MVWPENIERIIWFVGLLTAVWCGMVAGSFLNMLIYRLRHNKPLFGQAANRSYCPKCAATLGARDLIPIISYLIQKGRCRYCGEPIGRRYLWVELGCVLIALAIFNFII